MFKLKTTGTIFENRKEAIKIMGQSRYNRFLRNKEFEFINKEDNME